MKGENDAGFGETAAAQRLRKRPMEKLTAGDKPIKDMSVSEMSTFLNELRTHQVEPLPDDVNRHLDDIMTRARRDLVKE